MQHRPPKWEPWNPAAAYTTWLERKKKVKLVSWERKQYLNHSQQQQRRQHHHHHQSSKRDDQTTKNHNLDDVAAKLDETEEEYGGHNTDLIYLFLKTNYKTKSTIKY